MLRGCLPSERGNERAFCQISNGWGEVYRRVDFRLQSIGGLGIEGNDAGIAASSSVDFDVGLGGRGAMIGGSQFDRDKGMKLDAVGFGCAPAPATSWKVLMRRVGRGS